MHAPLGAAGGGRSVPILDIGHLGGHPHIRFSPFTTHLGASDKVAVLLVLRRLALHLLLVQANAQFLAYMF